MGDGDGDGAAEADAEDAADDAHDDGFDEELQHDVAEGRAERLPYADLTRALRDRDHHDVHDADAADEERDARDTAKEDRQHRRLLRHRLDEAREVVDGEVILLAIQDVVTLAQQRFDLALYLDDLRGLADLQVDHLDVRDAEKTLLLRHQRNDDHIVLILAHGGLSLAREDADDLERLIVDANVLADGILTAEEIPSDGRADDGDALALVVVRLRDEGADRQRERADRHILGRHAHDNGIPVLIAVDNLIGALHDGRNVVDVLDLLFDRDGVVVLQRLARSCRAANAARVRRAGRDDEHVAAEARHRVLDVALDAHADGDHRNDGGDADDDAEHGEDGAQFVRKELMQGDGDAFPNQQATSLLYDIHLDAPALVARDESVAHEKLTARAGSDVRLMRDEDDRASGGVKLLEEFHDLMRRFRVEIARRLVRHDDVRIVDEGARDGDALALTARKLVGLMVGTVGKPDGFQEVHGTIAPLASADARIDERQGDVFGCAAFRKQVEVLKYEADLLVAREGERVVREVRDLLAVELVRSFRRAVEAAEDVHERRLARAGRPHEGGELALSYRKIDARERGDDLIAHRIEFLDAPKLDRRLFLRRSLFLRLLLHDRSFPHLHRRVAAAAHHHDLRLRRRVGNRHGFALDETVEDFHIVIAVDACLDRAVLLRAVGHLDDDICSRGVRLQCGDGNGECAGFRRRLDFKTRRHGRQQQVLGVVDIERHIVIDDARSRSRRRARRGHGLPRIRGVRLADL